MSRLLETLLAAGETCKKTADARAGWGPRTVRRRVKTWRLRRRILPCRFAAKPGSGPATRIWAQELLPLTNIQNNFQDIAVIAIVAVSALLSVIAIASVIAVIAIVAVSAIVSVVLVGLHGGEGKSLLLQPLATVLGEDYVQEAPPLGHHKKVVELAGESTDTHRHEKVLALTGKGTDT